MQQLQQQPVQSATVFNVPGQPANVQYVIAVPPPPPQLTVYPNFPKKRAVAVGVTLIVFGFLSIVANVVEIAFAEAEAIKRHYYILDWLYGYIGHGFWVGIMCIIPGGIGIGAGIHKTRTRICAFNTMCILAASFAAVQFSIGLAGAIDGPHCGYYWQSGWGYDDDCGYLDSVSIAMEALLAFFAVVEAAFAIWGSVICCRTYCCYSRWEKNQPPRVMPQYATPISVVSGNNQPSTVQYPAVTIQGYQNVTYQPGYPVQPVQFSSWPPAYSVQGQYVTAPQQPNYPVMNQYEPLRHPGMIDGVQSLPTPTADEQIQTTSASVHQQPAYSPPDQHNDDPSKLSPHTVL